MKINKIICLGDSITGTCCTGYDFYDGLKFYPFLLGEHFNCEIKNYGQGNNSNEKIGIDAEEDGLLANDQYIQFYKGYFGANSDPSVLGTWMSDSDAHIEAIEMEKQVDAYLTEIKYYGYI